MPPSPPPPPHTHSKQTRDLHTHKPTEHTNSEEDPCLNHRRRRRRFQTELARIFTVFAAHTEHHTREINGWLAGAASATAAVATVATVTGTAMNTGAIETPARYICLCAPCGCGDDDGANLSVGM